MEDECHLLIGWLADCIVDVPQSVGND
jgi:hypothetical protein